MRHLRTPIVRYLSASALVLCLISSAVPQAAAMQPGQGGSPSLEHFLAQAPKGTLRVRAVQASAGGKSLAGASIEVDLFHGDRSFKQVTALLDENGEAVLTEIPVILGVEPVVRIKHDGVTYQEPGELMDPEKRDITIEVKVYDTTTEAPPWRISMRHIVVKPSAGGATGLLNVSEMVVVESGGDRTWVGSNPDERGKACTVRLDLPGGARRVQLESGFHGWCCTKYADPELSVWMPLMPGRSTFAFSYELPVAGAEHNLSVSAAAPTDHMMLFLPEELASRAASGALVEVPGGDGRAGKLLQGQGLAAGAKAGVVLTGLQSAGPAVKTKGPETSWVYWGVAIALAAGVAVLLLRRCGLACGRSMGP